MLSFAIFEIRDGTITWLQSVEGLRAAKALMRRIAASKPGAFDVLNYKRKRIFIIGYDETNLNARATLLRRFGHDVRTALGNEAALAALRSVRKIDLFVVGHAAPEQTRREMITWLRLRFPKAKIVSLNPGSRQITTAHYNVTCGKHTSDYISLAAAAGAS